MHSDDSSMDISDTPISGTELDSFISQSQQILHDNLNTVMASDQTAQSGFEGMLQT